MGQTLSLAVCVGIPLAQACINGIASEKHIKNWYAKLKKPKWTPPNWFFPPMESAMSICIGVASWLIWKKGGFKDQCTPLTLYGIQLALNALWSPIFFNGHKVKLALADAVACDAVAAATTVKFFEESKPAGCLMSPYLAYLAFCTVLNLKFAIDNPDADKIGETETPAPAGVENLPTPQTSTPASGSVPAEPAKVVEDVGKKGSGAVGGEIKKAK